MLENGRDSVGLAAPVTARPALLPVYLGIYRRRLVSVETRIAIWGDCPAYQDEAADIRAHLARMAEIGATMVAGELR